MSRFGKWSVTVLTMVTVATIVLLVTGWGSAFAAQVTSVLVTNGPSQPVPVQQQGTATVSVSGTPNVNVANTTVPVHEQSTANVNVTNTSVPVHDTNTDSSGNIKVHEQGTAAVTGQVANFNQSFATEIAPGVGNSGQVRFDGGAPDISSLQISMSDNVRQIVFFSNGGAGVLQVIGPAFTEGIGNPQIGQAHWTLTFPNPIQASIAEVFCGDTTMGCQAAFFAQGTRP